MEAGKETFLERKNIGKGTASYLFNAVLDNNLADIRRIIQVTKIQGYTFHFAPIIYGGHDNLLRNLPYNFI